MRLSTFNSNTLRSTIIYFVVMTLALGAGKMWLLGQLPDDMMPVPESFWWEKTHTQDQYDVVVIGDSRIYRGIAPEEMRSVTHGHRVLNFGFSAGGLSKELIEAGEQKLDPNGWNVMILGVTPNSLTDNAIKNEQYLQYKHTSRIDNAFLKVERLFGSSETMLALTYLLGRANSTKGVFQVPHADGWIESTGNQENANSAIAIYEQRFMEHQVNSQIQNELFGMVTELKRKGITVFAFRPPTTPNMEALESRLSGFDETAFVERFNQAGGIWIDIENRFGFHSYDGSHLQADSARLLSRYIAERVMAALERVAEVH